MRVTRPWKNSLCRPVPALNDSEPLGTLRVHALFRLFRAVCATHLPFTLRPGSSWSNTNRTDAGPFSRRQGLLRLRFTNLGIEIAEGRNPESQATEREIGRAQRP